MGRGWLSGCVPLAEARARLGWKASLGWKRLNLSAWRGRHPLGRPGTMRRWSRAPVRLGEAQRPLALKPLAPTSQEKECLPLHRAAQGQACLPR